MEIVDDNGTTKTVDSISLVTHHYTDNNGRDVEEVFVAAVVTSTRSGRTWTEWYVYETFVTNNPGLNITAITGG